MKRYSLRMVPVLESTLKGIAKERGTSLNGLITQILWEFVEEFQKKK